MVISVCQHESRQKHGKDSNGKQRYKCLLCNKTFVEREAKPLGDMRTPIKQAALALSLLLEGMSVRSVQRLTGLKRSTIGQLILTVGENCERLFLAKVRGVEATDIQCDEIWSFVRCKEKTRVASRYTGEEGDSWTWTAIDRNTKLMLAYQIGQRDNESCMPFLRRLEAATVGRCQISTDGLAAYTLNVPYTFRERVDFAQLIKTYGPTQSTGRYSPPKIIGADKRPVFGDPDPDQVCTSHVERMNLTIRMTLRRFTRLTNAHSKSLKHHRGMQAIFFAFYNFCRKHETLKGRTPAMAAGLAERAWTVRELIERAAAN